MTAMELQHLLLKMLHDYFRAESDPPRAFVGVQGDNLVIMQAGGQHLGILIVPAKAEVPA